MMTNGRSKTNNNEYDGSDDDDIIDADGEK